MKLSKITDSLEWYSKIAQPTKVAQNATSVIKHASVDTTPSEQVGDVVLANECVKIEKSASANQPYYCNHNWSFDVVGQLREYASVCGLKQFVMAEASSDIYDLPPTSFSKEQSVRSTVDAITMRSLPHFLIIYGNPGSGRNGVAEKLSKELDLELKTFDVASVSKPMDAWQPVNMPRDILKKNNCVLLITGMDSSASAQNAFVGALEDTDLVSQNIFIVLIVNSLEYLKKALVSRSQGNIYHIHDVGPFFKQIDEMKRDKTFRGSLVGQTDGIPEIPKDVKEEKVLASNNQQVKTASVTETPTKPAFADQLKSILGDPFHIEANSNTDHMKEDKWEKVTLSAKLPEIPLMTIGIIPVRGGEDYTISNTPNFAVNQNTMANPKAIEQLAESTAHDTGMRLALERADREGKKVAERKQWEQDAIDAMPMRNVIAHGNVFPIGAENAQSGLNNPSSQMGVYAKFDKNDLPEKTAGEQIKDKNDAYRKSISREREDYKWEEVRGTTRPSVSDIFVDELKKRLGK